MKKVYIYLFISIFYFSSSAQQKERIGLVNYGEIQSLGVGSSLGYDYNASLIFNSANSLYTTRKDSLENSKLNAQSDVSNNSKRASFTISTSKEGFQYYFERKYNIFYSRDIGFKYVKDTEANIVWEIKEEKKKIGDFECTKAISSFRGRKYTAWFTSEIPLPYGPWKLHGLPGLILEAYDQNKEIYWYFKNLQYPCDCDIKLNKIKLPTSKTFIKHEEFKKILIQEYESSIIAGRMVAEKAGIPIITSGNKMTNFSIEAFDTRD